MARARQPPLVFIDTHVVCWLYQGSVELLSEPAREAIENGRLQCSPIVELEIEYLYEIGRLAKDSATVLAALRDEIDLQTSSIPFARIINAARKLSWTRDPFDRILVAEATTVGAKLVTKDAFILKNFKNAVW